MKTRVHIEMAFCRTYRDHPGFSLTLDCKTPARKLIYTTFVFDPDAPRSSPHFQKWGLLQLMARAYDVQLPTNLTDAGWLIGKFYLFEFEEWKDQWLIRRFKRCEPFKGPDIEAMNRAMEELFSGKIF